MQEESKKQRKERLRKERTAQNSIHYKAMLEDGVCILEDGLYSKCVRFDDINYRIATDEVKDEIIIRYKKLLNSLGNEQDVSLVISNRLINQEEFEQNVLMKHHGDGLDNLREELNQHLVDNMEKGNNSIVSDKMFVFTCKEDNVLEARKVLFGIEKDFRESLRQLGCNNSSSMDGIDRMSILHSITKPKEKLMYTYEDLAPGVTTKDWITPYVFDFKKDYFEMGDRYCTVLKLLNYPTYLYDNLIHELSKLESNLLITLHMSIMGKDKAIELINKKSQITDIQVDNENEKRHKRGDFSDTLPPRLSRQVESIREWRTAVEKGDERVYKTQLTVMINSATLDEMNAFKRDVIRIGKRCSCEFVTMEYEQEIGLNDALPLGNPIGKSRMGRLLLTDNIANIMPFTSQELLDDRHPMFYGINQTTNNLILCNRKNLTNRNGFILGKTGGGKSFASKKEMTQILLNDPNADIIIIDPQGEYRILAETINKYSNKKQADVLEISSKSKLYFNPFDGDITQPNFVKEKADFILVIMAEMIGNGYLSPEQVSLVDQVVHHLYDEYEQNLKKGNYAQAIMPTLETFYLYLDNIDSMIAKQVQQALWSYVYGSYDLFAHQSNINSDSRVLIYDIHEIGNTIERLGYKIILESCRSRILKNHAIGRSTYIYIDEIYLLLADEYSENFLFEFWKWVRKFGGACTGMTQNVTDLLRSQKVCTMLANSEFYIILPQDKSDLLQLKSLLNLSEEQSQFVLTAAPGSGLIRFGNVIIPFADSFAKNTICYDMWNTDPKGTEEDNELLKQLEKAREYQKQQEEKKMLQKIFHGKVEKTNQDYSLETVPKETVKEKKEHVQQIETIVETKVERTTPVVQEQTTRKEMIKENVNQDLSFDPDDY